jgi:hypothetical protein
MTGAEIRAHALLRCYPRAWRDRYGDEFAALLADDLAERPRSLRRDLDVLRCGVTARRAAGRPSIALAASLVFVAAATSIWTQLARGTVNTRPDSGAVTLGLVTLSLFGVAIVVAVAAGTAELLAAAVRTIRAGGVHRLLRPAAMTVAGAAALVTGAIDVGSHAQVAASHPGLIAGAARWTSAATESISTYWIHPDRLLALPTSELAWMLASPVAAIACCRGLLGLVARTDLVHTIHHTGRRLAAAAMLPALVTAATWVLGSQHDPNASLRAGSIDLALVAAMTVAVLTIEAATSRPRRSLA